MLICFQSHNLAQASNSGSFGIAGYLAVLAGVVRNIEVSARGELIATKTLAGYFLSHQGYNFTLKTSSIP